MAIDEQRRVCHTQICKNSYLLKFRIHCKLCNSSSQSAHHHPHAKKFHFGHFPFPDVIFQQPGAGRLCNPSSTGTHTERQDFNLVRRQERLCGIRKDRKRALPEPNHHHGNWQKGLFPIMAGLGITNPINPNVA